MNTIMFSWSQFQQLREQMEAEISRLKQENGILRDAVSTSTNQMESKYAIVVILLKHLILWSWTSNCLLLCSYNYNVWLWTNIIWFEG